MSEEIQDISEELKSLLTEHSYYKRYEESSVVTHTTGDSINFYKATKNVPRYVSINNKSYWKRLNTLQQSTGEDDYDNQIKFRVYVFYGYDIDGEYHEPTSFYSITSDLDFSKTSYISDKGVCELCTADSNYSTTTINLNVNLNSVDNVKFSKWQQYIEGNGWMDISQAENIRVTVSSTISEFRLVYLPEEEAAGKINISILDHNQDPVSNSVLEHLASSCMYIINNGQENSQHYSSINVVDDHIEIYHNFYRAMLYISKIVDIDNVWWALCPFDSGYIVNKEYTNGSTYGLVLETSTLSFYNVLNITIQLSEYDTLYIVNNDYINITFKAAYVDGAWYTIENNFTTQFIISQGENVKILKQANFIVKYYDIYNDTYVQVQDTEIDDNDGLEYWVIEAPFRTIKILGV